MYGRILDVVVDLRSWESTYMGVQTWELAEAGQGQVYVPAGCAHGFMAKELSGVLYLQQGIYNSDSPDKAVNAFDPELKIVWPPSSSGDYIMSSRDKTAPTWEQLNA
jgi:dTDP-4-dehydrorhamnose 3,5-epimerase